jgi:hypothetical protein
MTSCVAYVYIDTHTHTQTHTHTDLVDCGRDDCNLENVVEVRFAIVRNPDGACLACQAEFLHGLPLCLPQSLAACGWRGVESIGP